MNSTLLCVLLGASAGIGADPTKPAPRPNIVLIMADDLGFSDIGCYGSEMATPNLDKLAKEGLRFSQFYNAGRCCPTRAALLTGLYAHQAGVGHMLSNRGTPAYQGNLKDSCVTIAEVLKQAGYTTLMSGKWHVANRQDTWPNQRGFDRYYGTPSGGGVYFKDNFVTRSGVFFTLDGKKVEIPADWYVTDALTDQAIQFLDEASKRDQPFFLYLAHLAPHWPLQAKKRDIDRYRGRYDVGWDIIRARRHARLVEEGLVDPAWKLSDRPDEAPAWNTLSAEKRADLSLRMAVYAAQIDCIDQNVGRLVDSLKKAARFENTLIVFLSDNGSSAEEVAQKGIDGRGVDDPGSYFSAGLPWANAANTPFRKYKMWTHEGGIATPLIVSWPAGIPKPGRIVRAPGHVIDLMPTFLDLARATYSQTARGVDVLPLAGVSLRPALAGEPIRRTAPLFWEHEGNRAIRQGKWKLVAPHKGAWELYDLEADRTERHNLAAKHPEQVRELTALYEQWARNSGVLPWDEVVKKSGK
ncbi:MAG: arylsulfatase [Planctomycetia bacterium]|nr:arylsulfatase [Planctomycetia bacterium]